MFLKKIWTTESANKGMRAAE